MLDEIPIEDQYVFTSLRYDGSMKRNSQNPVCCPDSKAAYLIKYHYERLVTAADHLGWYDTSKRLKGPVDLFTRIQSAVTEHKKKTGNKCPFKVCKSVSPSDPLMSDHVSNRSEYACVTVEKWKLVSSQS
jgi:4-amino-4-deoxychorismate lyase